MAARNTITAMWGIGVLALVGLATSDAAARADLRRCEDSSGHITYSNEPCPTGTAKERSVDDRPAVEVPHDATSEKASLRSGKASSTAPATSIVPSGNAGQAKTPEHSQELAREQQKSLVARCDDLVRRIEYAQQDQLSATPSERASIELELHRLQDEHETTCVTH